MGLIKKVEQNIKSYKLFESGETLILAISGGADSVVLLDAINKLLTTRPEYSRRVNHYLFTVIVVHLNHGLRGKDSDADQRFVKRLAKKYGLKFETKKINIKKIAKRERRNLEEVAREERYKFFAKIAQKYKTDKIITAHHADDQVETVLLNYLRGAGPQGLSGMVFKSLLPHVPFHMSLIRPLLNVWRKEILEYQKKNNLEFREDRSNFDLRLRRNHLRLKVIPELEKQDKKFKQKVLAQSFKIKKSLLGLDPKITKVYEIIKEKELKKAVVLSISRFNRLGNNLKAEILKKAFRYLFSGDLKGIQENNIIDASELIEKASAGKEIILSRQLKVVIDYDTVILLKGPLSELKIKNKELKIRANELPEIGLTIDLEISRKSKRDCFNFDFEKIDFPLFVRSVKPGDSIKPSGFSGTKKLQDLFVDLKIPKRLRSMIPIIIDKNGRILGVLGIRQSREVEADSKTKEILSIGFKRLK